MEEDFELRKRLELIRQAEEVVRESGLKSLDGVSDAMKFLGLFSLTYTYEIMKEEIVNLPPVNRIIDLNFAVKHFLKLTNSDAVDLLYGVMYNTWRSYMDREAYEIARNVNRVNAKVQDLIKEVYPDIDPMYFSTTDPEEMIEIAASRMKTYVKTWLPGLQ